MVLRFIHVLACNTDSFLWLIFHYMDFPTFCYPVDRHLGCFHLLAFVDSAAMNTCVQVLFEQLFSINWGILLGPHRGVELLIIWWFYIELLRSYRAVSTVEALFYIRNRRVSILYTLVSTYYSFLLLLLILFLSLGRSWSFSLPLSIFLTNYHHPSGCEVISPSGFDLPFPNDQWCCFRVSVGHLCIFFWETSVQVIFWVVLF